MRGRPIPVQTIQQIQRLAQVTSIRKTAREASVAPNTVVKYRKK